MATKRYVLHWCIITLCTLLTTAIITFSLLCLCSPKTIAKFSATLGLDRAETYFYTADYARHGDVDSLYKVVVKNYNLKNYAEVEKYYEKLEHHPRYIEFINFVNAENLKVETSNLAKSALLNEDNYLKNRYVISLINNGKVEKAFTYAVEHFKDYTNYTLDSTGNYLFYNLVSLNKKEIYQKFNNSYGFDDTLYDELTIYVDQCIVQFENGFDPEFNADLDSAKLLALNTRINQVYGDIEKISTALNFSMPNKLPEKVASINAIASELL